MRVALVHDWLTGMRGGEKVLEVLCDLYPDADILTLFHRPGSVSATIERHHIETSWLQRLPFTARHYRRYLPLFPSAVERFLVSEKLPSKDLGLSRLGSAFRTLAGAAQTGADGTRTLCGEKAEHLGVRRVPADRC